MEKTIKAMKAAFSETKKRCLNPKHRQYKYYGGRGITICDRWLESFDNYLADMGVRPVGMTLERRENDKGYSPDNCEWAGRDVQANNRRATVQVTYEGETHNISEWERLKGFKPGTLKARLGSLNYSLEDAFNKPVKCGTKLEGRRYAPRKAQDNTKIKRGMDARGMLSTASRKDIRKSADAGETYQSIADRYGFSRGTIANVILRKRGYKNA